MNFLSLYFLAIFVWGLYATIDYLVKQKEIDTKIEKIYVNNSGKIMPVLATKVADENPLITRSWHKELEDKLNRNTCYDWKVEKTWEDSGVTNIIYCKQETTWEISKLVFGDWYWQEVATFKHRDFKTRDPEIAQLLASATGLSVELT